MVLSPSSRASFEAADRSALVIAHDAATAAAHGKGIAAAGLRVVAAVSHDEAAATAPLAHLSILYLDLAGADEATADALATRIVAAARSHAIALIVEFDAAQIDLVGAALLGSSATLLCEPGAGDRVAAVALAGARPPRATDRRRDASDERLKRLNEEVARIAETLSRLTRGDAESPRASVEDRVRGYGAPPSAILPGTGKAAGVRAIIRARRLRDQHLGEGLFADPAWDMLLDLHAAELEGAQVSVSSLCIAAAVPPTTALRWIQTMHDRGLCERAEDPFDKRRAYIALSDQGREAMAAYFVELGERAPRVI